MDTTIVIDTILVLIAAILIFFMNLGFTSVEDVIKIRTKEHGYDALQDEE